MMHKAHIKLTAIAVLAAMSLVLGSGVASADPQTFPNGSFADDQLVICNYNSHQIFVYPQAVAQPGFNSEYMQYQVGIQDITFGTNARWQWFTTQGNFLVVSTTYVNGAAITQRQFLGNAFTINAVAGHSYRVGVIYRWWNIFTQRWEQSDANGSMSYTETYLNGSSLNPWSSYPTPICYT
jgi:hypothetical protein